MPELVECIRQTPNRGTTHLFFGHPLSDMCDKTTVEPGNAFSPGLWTCGIAVWVEHGGVWHTPDLLPDDAIQWGFVADNGCLPILESRYHAGPHLQISNRMTHLGGEGAHGTDYVELLVLADAEVNATVAVVVRDVGPAGGKIESLGWDAATSTLHINSAIRLIANRAPAECRIIPADDQHDSPIAILSWPVELQRQESLRLSFSVEHGFANRPFAEHIPAPQRPRRLTVEEAVKRGIAEWKQAIPARVYAPDPRIAKAWGCSAFHLLNNMECGVPRIGTVNYPAFWMRDGVIALRALDLLGCHHLARIGNDYLAPLYFSGGFGAEADAPGQGIWALTQHAVMTQDTDWLATVFPHIQARVDWITRMRTATAPIRVLTENRLPAYQATPGSNVLCLPARHGLIHGRMDWHSPDFYINCWATCGLASAAEAATLLGHIDLATEWGDDAMALEDAIVTHLLPQYGNDRDAIVTPYPTAVLAGESEELADRLTAWYHQRRLTENQERNPEPLWSYFEAAHVHNAMLLGQRDAAWISLDGLLNDGAPWEVYAYPEGEPHGKEYLPYRNGQEARGWLRPNARGGNMPHIWTAAEMLTLIRDMFVREDGEMLVLGSGVPTAWLTPGAWFGIEDMPTRFGPVSYAVLVHDDGQIAVEYSGPENYQLDFLPAEAIADDGQVVAGYRV